METKKYCAYYVGALQKQSANTHFKLKHKIKQFLAPIFHPMCQTKSEETYSLPEINWNSAMPKQLVS